MRYYYLRFPQFKLKALTLSYDDGTIFDRPLIDILNKYGIKCTFNISSGQFDCMNKILADEAVKLYAAPHEAVMHGFRHKIYVEESSAVVTADILKDREALEKLFNKRIYGLAYPNGTFNDRIVNIVDNCGVKYARTAVSSCNFDLPEDWLRLSPTCHHTESNLFELAETFLQGNFGNYYRKHSPKLFYLWGHSFEFDRDNNWDRIEKFCEMMSNNKEIWYATNTEIYDYVQAFNRLEYTADGNTAYNPTVTDIYLNVDEKDILVKSGETVKLR